MNEIIIKIDGLIINFTNRFMQCRQSTVGAGKPTIQHCILDSLAGFLKYLRTSNICRRNTDAVKIKDANDFQKEYHDDIINEMCVSFSNIPASTDAAILYDENNFNNANNRK